MPENRSSVSRERTIACSAHRIVSPCFRRGKIRTTRSTPRLRTGIGTLSDAGWLSPAGPDTASIVVVFFARESVSLSEKHEEATKNHHLVFDGWGNYLNHQILLHMYSTLYSFDCVLFTNLGWVYLSVGVLSILKCTRNDTLIEFPKNRARRPEPEPTGADR